MKYSVLISDKRDPHVRAVLQHIESYPETNYLFIDTKEALNFNIHFSFLKGSTWRGTFCGIDISQIHSIWYRRPERPKSDHLPFSEELQKLCESEMNATLQDFYRISDCKILSHPDSIRVASHKLLQLKVAARVGMNVPKTFLSNDVDSISENIVHDQYYCIKSLSDFYTMVGDDEYGFYSAKVLGHNLLERREDFRILPVYMQEYVEKRYEWRITVVGDKIFPCRLDSQSVQGAQDDWRLVDFTLVPHDLLEIPEELKEKIKAYLVCMNLKFGAFDFIESSNGTFTFLECNPNGQWMWIEVATGVSISKAIADFLFSE